jgi:hypothetical protein
MGQGVPQDIFKAGLEKSIDADMQIVQQQQRKSLMANQSFQNQFARKHQRKYAITSKELYARKS